jgi:hypothetical protein
MDPLSANIPIRYITHQLDLKDIPLAAKLPEFE